MTGKSENLGLLVGQRRIADVTCLDVNYLLSRVLCSCLCDTVGLFAHKNPNVIMSINVNY